MSLKNDRAITVDGYEIVNVNKIPEKEYSERYVNPKMEAELVLFKVKIVNRYAKRDLINHDYVFPRQTAEKKKLTLVIPLKKTIAKPFERKSELGCH